MILADALLVRNAVSPLKMAPAADAAREAKIAPVRNRFNK